MWDWCNGVAWLKPWTWVFINNPISLYSSLQYTPFPVHCTILVFQQQRSHQMLTPSKCFGTLNRNALAWAKAFPLKHCKAENKGGANQWDRKILDWESGCRNVYKVCQALAQSVADSCRAAGKSFQKLVLSCTLQTLTKTAPLGATTANKSHD